MADAAETAADAAAAEEEEEAEKRILPQGSSAGHCATRRCVCRGWRAQNTVFASAAESLLLSVTFVLVTTSLAAHSPPFGSVRYTNCGEEQFHVFLQHVFFL